MQEVLQTYRDRFPWHAHATDNLLFGCKMYEATEALKKAIVQHNAKHSVAWLVYDLDSETAATDWIAPEVPIPNILAVNPDNGHAHLFYGLEVPVHDYYGASDKAKRYMAAVDIALTATLKADPAYSKFMSKNPLNERWSVVVPREELYTLETLSTSLDLDNLMDRRRNLPDVGYGRNCNLFHRLRKWAYSERRKPQMYFDYQMFFEACKWRALAINAEFDQPLPHSEVRATAKSVSKWTWRNMSEKGFREWAKRKGEASGRVRKAKSMELREKILETLQDCPQLSQGDIAALMGVRRETVNRHISALKNGCDLNYIR